MTLTTLDDGYEILLFSSDALCLTTLIVGAVMGGLIGACLHGLFTDSS